jgi:hypothetical protein
MEYENDSKTESGDVIGGFSLSSSAPPTLTWASQVVNDPFFYDNVKKWAPVINILHISPAYLQSLVFRLLLVIISRVLALLHPLDLHSNSHHSLFHPYHHLPNNKSNVININEESQESRNRVHLDFDQGEELFRLMQRRPLRSNPLAQQLAAATSSFVCYRITGLIIIRMATDDTYEDAQCIY